MSFSIVSQLAGVRRRWDKYVWGNGLDSGPHTVWFPNLSETRRVLNEVPERVLQPRMILEVKGHRPKGKWVYIVYGEGRKSWYLARTGTALRMKPRRDDVIRADVQHFATHAAADQAIRELPEKKQRSARWLRVYV